MKACHYRIILKVPRLTHRYVFLNDITEIRTSCGFRENMIQESTKPYRRSRFKVAWLIHSWTFCSRMYEFLDEITEIRIYCGFRENMIQVANKPFDVSRLESACLLISWMIHSRYHMIIELDSCFFQNELADYRIKKAKCWEICSSRTRRWFMRIKKQNGFSV